MQTFACAAFLCFLFLDFLMVGLYNKTTFQQKGDTVMEKLAYFFIDDVIWCLRDLTRQRPTSVFDNAFFKMLKHAHDDHGLTVQLNLFYRTDFFYGSDEFTLAQMTDAYKAEFKANADWLRFAFHAKQEFPDYPYVNATYEDVKADYEAIHNEVLRFAGEGSWSAAVIPHWMPISKAGCKALADCGVKFMATSVGDRCEFNGDDNSLLYGMAARLRQNRQPETGLQGSNPERAYALVAYNHLTDEQYNQIEWRNASILDKETGMHFRQLGRGPLVNANTQEKIRERLAELNGSEFIGTGNHEQYFYKDFYRYIPDIAERIYVLAETLHEYGYRFITADEMR